MKHALCHSVLVTGAGGFVGGTVVRRLAAMGYKVRAAFHRLNGRDPFEGMEHSDTVVVDILDRQSLDVAMKDVDAVLHFAALVDPSRPVDELHRVNVEGTRNVWLSAAANDVRRAIFCSSAAVYGLLRRKGGTIAESSPARAMEPYGRTKVLAEREALSIGAATGLHTTIVRPVAIFGPGEHTPFGKKLRDAAVSRLLFAGGFQNKRFSFVQVEDVAGAAIHLMQANIPSGEIFNVAADEPILFQDAFDAYIRVLERAGEGYARIRLLALVSRTLHKSPLVLRAIPRAFLDRYVFGLWRPGFDLTYSSAKLQATSFRPAWNNFEEVFLSCLDEDLRLRETARRAGSCDEHATERGSLPAAPLR